MSQHRYGPIPPELSRSAPRQVRLTANGKAVAIAGRVLLAAALFCGILLFNVSIRDRSRRELLYTQGGITSAKVIQLGRAKDSGCAVVLRYTVDGQPHELKARLHRPQCRVLRIGSPLQVRYLATNPEQAWIVGREPKGFPVWVVPLVSLSLGACAWLCFYVLARQSRLVSEWRPAQARVTRTQKDAYGHIVHYEYRILSGALRTGKYGPVSSPPKPGTSVFVLYDREAPERNSHYPMSMVQVQTRRLEKARKPRMPRSDEGKMT